MTMRGLGHKSAAFGAPTPQRRHVRLDPGLVDEDEASRIYVGLARLPAVSLDPALCEFVCQAAGRERARLKPLTQPHDDLPRQHARLSPTDRRWQNRARLPFPLCPFRHASRINAQRLADLPYRLARRKPRQSPLTQIFRIRSRPQTTFPDA